MRATKPIGRYYAFEVTQAAAFTLPIFAVFFQARGLSLAAIGLVEAVYTVVSILAETPTGYLGDRLGRRRTLLGSALLAGVGAVAFAFAHHLWYFLLVIVLRAVAGAFRSGTGEAWLYEVLAAREGLDEGTFADYRGRASALSRATAGVSVLLGGALYAIDPVAPWLVEGAVVGAGGALALTLPEPPRTAEGPATDGDPSPLVALRAARETLVRPDVGRFVAYTGLVFAVSAGVHVILQPVSVGLVGVDPAHLGVLYAALVGVSALAAERAGWVRDSVGIERWFRLAPPAAGVLAVGVVVAPPVALAAFVVLRGVRSVSGPLAGQYLNDRSGSTGRATTLSAAAMVRGVMVAPTKLLAGVAAGRSLGLSVAGLGVVLLAGSVLAVLAGGAVATRAETGEAEPPVEG